MITRDTDEKFATLAEAEEEAEYLQSQGHRVSGPHKYLDFRGRPYWRLEVVAKNGKGRDARHITVGTPSGEKTYLVRGDWTEQQLKDQYEKFKLKFRSDIPFERWLAEYGKVYVRTRDAADRRARLHRALDVVMDRTADATGEPTGFGKQSNVKYLVHGLHGMKTPTLAGNYWTKPEALRAAQQAANEEGETVTVSTPKGPWITVQPK
jgi:hypothetical protein